MSQYDFDSNQEGDWEEPESTAWNEADWQVYLRKSDREVLGSLLHITNADMKKIVWKRLLK